MKKKILTLCLIVALAATAVVGGSLAYFTDTDEADNVFTSGKVDITLIENFDENNANLLPGKVNAVTKEVSIKLEDDSQDAYVWYEYLIPAAVDSVDGSTGTNNIVHVNALGRTWDTYRENEAYWAEGQTEALPLEQTWDHTTVGGPEGYVGQETIDGVLYNKYVVLYHGKMTAGQETSIAMSQVYLDAKVDCDADTGIYSIDGVDIDFDLTELHILVRAYAIQAAGFADVYAAYEAYNA